MGGGTGHRAQSLRAQSQEPDAGQSSVCGGKVRSPECRTRSVGTVESDAGPSDPGWLHQRGFGPTWRPGQSHSARGQSPLLLGLSFVGAPPPGSSTPSHSVPQHLTKSPWDLQERARSNPSTAGPQDKQKPTKLNAFYCALIKKQNKYTPGQFFNQQKG